MTSRTVALLLIGVLSVGLPVHAANHDLGAGQGTPAVVVHKAHGVVNSVDVERGKVGISHDPIESLKWPGMKMNFQVQEPAVLNNIKPGMTVDFELQKIGNAYRIINIAPTQ
jgi:Cu/Ag efflux protein CusF